MKNLLHLKHKNSPNKVVKTKFGSIANNPYIDWVLILCITAVSSIVFVIAGIYKYSEVMNRLEGNVSVENNIRKNIDMKALQNILDKIESKKKDRTNYSKLISPNDPSW